MQITIYLEFPAIILLFHGVGDMQIVVALILSSMNPSAMTWGKAQGSVSSLCFTPCLQTRCCRWQMPALFLAMRGQNRKILVTPHDLSSWLISIKLNIGIGRGAKTAGKLLLFVLKKACLKH